MEQDPYTRIVAAAVIESAFSRVDRAGAKLWDGLKYSFQWLQQRQLDRQHKEVIRDLFGLKGTVGLLPGANHYQLPNQWHPDNIDAADKVQQIATHEKLITSHQYLEVAANNNLIVFGGPTSSVFSRRILGYWNNSIQGGDPPIEYDFFITAPDVSKTARRYVGKQDYEYPLSYLVSKQGKRVLEPTLKNGFQNTDVLIIYRIPNLENENALKEGKDEIFVCGLHGPGTKAIGLLFQDRESLLQMKKSVGDHKYYQAVFRVDSIRQDDKNMETIPESISFLTAQPLAIDPERLKSWVVKHKSED